MHTFVIVLTKNSPIRRRYRLDANCVEHVEEEIIEDFEPYSRVVYVRALTPRDAQVKLYDYMHDNKLDDWAELTDGLAIT